MISPKSKLDRTSVNAGAVDFTVSVKDTSTYLSFKTSSITYGNKENLLIRYVEAQHIEPVI